jgi:hypothetical protein
MQSGIDVMTGIAVTPAVLHNRKIITMTTKEFIKAKIDNVDDSDLEELYKLVKRSTETKEQTGKPGLLARLQTIQIDGPEDFSENLDLYLIGEKHFE